MKDIAFLEVALRRWQGPANWLFDDDSTSIYLYIPP